MPMDYTTRWWVRLYTDEATEHHGYPVLARSLRDYLLRKAERLQRNGDPAPHSGRLVRSRVSKEHAIQTLVLSLVPHPEEVDQLTRYINDWIEEGYLVWRGAKGRKPWYSLYIKNYVAAQTSRTKNAERQRRYRQRHIKKKKPVEQQGLPAVTRNATGNVSGDATGNVAGDERVPSRREEQKKNKTRTGSEQILTRARAYQKDPLAAGMTHGEPHTWTETQEVIEAMNTAWAQQVTLRNSGDPRVRTLVDRFAEGYTPEQLIEAVQGAALDPFIRERPILQTVTTILKTPDKVDGYRHQLANPPEAKSRAPAVQPPAGDPSYANSGWVTKAADEITPGGDPWADEPDAATPGSNPPDDDDQPTTRSSASN